MKKVISWVASSFFRQAGRFLFYIVLGGMIFLLFKANDFKLNFADILLPMHVKADSYVRAVDTPWYQSDRTTRLPSRNAFDYITQQSGLVNSTMKLSWFYNADQFDTTVIRGGYWEVPFYVETQIIRREDNSVYSRCDQWRQNSSGGWYCYTVSNSNDYEYNYLTPQLTVQVIAVYKQGYTDICNVDLLNNRIHCPVATYTNLTGIASVQVFTNVWYANSNTENYTYYVGLGRKVNQFQTDSGAIINNQNQNTNQTLNFFSDTNTTSSSNTTSNFFSETNSTSESALTSIVSAPLTLINSLVVGTHDSICATLNSKQICLPSGDIIWNRSTSSQNHGGSGVHDHWFRGGSVEQFIAFFNLVVGGFILYKCLLSIFNMVHKLLDPANSWVGVMKL